MASEPTMTIDFNPDQLAELRAIADDMGRAGPSAVGNNLAALWGCIQGECVELRGCDPVEAEIAAAVAGGMSSSGAGEWEDETIGVRVAKAIKAYRREMAKPDEDDPS